MRLLHRPAAHLDHHCQEECSHPGGAVLWLGARHHCHGYQQRWGFNSGQNGLGSELRWHGCLHSRHQRRGWQPGGGAGEPHLHLPAHERDARREPGHSPSQVPQPLHHVLQLRCEFSLCSCALSPGGAWTLGFPLHHQLHARRTHDAHPHLHCLLHDSSTSPGQERFTSMTRLYYREASACVIMFDVTNTSTFSNSQKWKQDLDSKLLLPDGSPVPCLLLANKCDLSPWAVTREEVDRFSKENGFSGWVETSVKENKNINESMRVLIEKMMSSSAGDGSSSAAGSGDYINIKEPTPPGWTCC
uniref:Solute carrier family 41 member 1 n=1 Tax=Amazona collaria TaxID=241587 RepID=A0A8B9FDT1_9PSIT